MKLKILICLSVFVVTIEGAEAQSITWQRTYGEGNIDYGYSIVQTPDEGYIAVGRKRIQTTESFSYVMRLDKYGDTIWTKIYPGFESKKIIKSSDNYYIINSRYSLFKIDINGNVIWTKLGIEDIILESNDGGFFGCFGTSIRKFNSFGDTVWNRNYSNLINGYFHNFDFNSNNELIIVGSFVTKSNNQNNRFLMKVKQNGDFVSLNNFYWDRIPFIMVSVEMQNFVVSSDSRPQLAKFDSTGKIIWDKIYFGVLPEYSQTYDFIKTYDGGFILTGTYHNGDFNYFVLNIKIDTFGDEQWRKLFGFGDHDEGRCIKQTKDSGYVNIGIRDNFNLGDIYIIKTDKTGNSNPPVSVNSINTIESNGYNLFQNYPNPFNPTTKISYSIPVSGNISIKIYDLTGKEVKTLLNEFKSTGSYDIEFNGSDLSSGVYFYKLDASGSNSKGFVMTKRMVLLK